jgi:uncharacterized protein YbgA (DUF1722 family)
MNDRMTMEQRLDFTEGQVTVLKHALALLVMVHPHKNQMGQIIKNMASYPIEDVSSEYFRAGIRDVVENLDDLSKTTVLTVWEENKWNSKKISR